MPISTVRAIIKREHLFINKLAWQRTQVYFAPKHSMEEEVDFLSYPFYKSFQEVPVIVIDTVQPNLCR